MRQFNLGLTVDMAERDKPKIVWNISLVLFLMSEKPEFYVCLWTGESRAIWGGSPSQR